jgi:hypothetical protein
VVDKVIEIDPKFKDEPATWSRDFLRHEIFHAFLFESGFNNYYDDEQLVDMLALQFHKLAKIIQDAEDQILPEKAPEKSIKK